jgi:hypothetical protein
MTEEQENQAMEWSKDISGKESLALVLAIGGNSAASSAIKTVIKYIADSARNNRLSQKDVWDSVTNTCEPDTLRYWLLRASYYVDRHIRN